MKVKRCLLNYLSYFPGTSIAVRQEVNYLLRVPLAIAKFTSFVSFGFSVIFNTRRLFPPGNFFRRTRCLQALITTHFPQPDEEISMKNKKIYDFFGYFLTSGRQCLQITSFKSIFSEFAGEFNRSGV